MAQRIKAIRFVAPTKDDKNVSEIFKLVLSTNKDDFYLIRKKNELKMSFHKDGTKYLRFQNDENKYETTLYKNEHYVLNGINPIFSYFPSEISSYITKPNTVEPRTATVTLKPRNNDFGINVFWVNADTQDQFLLPSNSCNSCNSKLKCEICLNDSPSEKEVFDKPTAIEFGHQTLFFDVFDVKRNSADRKYEALRIYKPGTVYHIQAYTNHVLNADLGSIEKQGCSIIRNQNDGYYTLVF